MAICTECYIVVPYDWILSHFKRNHGIKVTLEELAIYLNIEEPTMTYIEAKTWISETWIISRPNLTTMPTPNEASFGALYMG